MKSTTDQPAHLPPIYQELECGITCIDTDLVRPGLASCYLMVHKGRAAIIETGTDHTVARIMALLAQKGLQPEQVDYVIPTHVHLDHAGGAGGLMQQLPNATLVVHPRGARHMISPEKLMAGTIAVYGEQMFTKMYGKLIPVDENRVQIMSSGHVSLADRPLEIIDSPGHAFHHFCVYDRYSASIFSGDTLGISYRELDTSMGPFIFPTTTPVQFAPDALIKTLDTLSQLPLNYINLTHFGQIPAHKTIFSRLAEQVQEYLEICAEVKGSVEPSHWTEVLEQKIEHLLIQNLRKHQTVLSDDECAEIIRFDCRLNAQGLAVWMARSLKSN